MTDRAANQPATSTPPVPLDLLVLLLHEPYRTPEHPVPINATVVHCLTLLHPGVPQPAGGLMYQAFARHHGHRPGDLVPLSTLTSRIGGDLNRCTPEWEDVVNAVVAVARAGRCDAVPLGLPPVSAAHLALGPDSALTVTDHHGGKQIRGSAERQRELAELASRVETLIAGAPLWPGDGLLAPPAAG